MSGSVAETTKEIEEGPEALAAAVDIPKCDGDDKDNDNDKDTDNDDESTSSTVDLRQLIHAEVVPSKSVVVIWILMAVELGFDLITTAIAFASTLGKQDCCGYTVYLGPLPMTTSLPFFFLILAEITFLGRAILLTLWPSTFEARRVAFHGTDDDDDDDENVDDPHQVGFEVTLAATKDDEESGSREDNGEKDEDDTSDVKDSDGSVEVDDETNEEDGSTTTEKAAETEIEEDTSGTNEEETSETKQPESPAADPDDAKSQQGEEELHQDKAPEFVDTNAKPPKNESWWKRLCCCLLRWNAKMVLSVLNLLTLLNPFFGCLIAYILLYQSDKTECFVVLGIESLSIVLHFVSVRMEGGLRTWWSKALHSIALVPFLVTVILVLVFLREGGMCYSVESELFLFSGCEVCPDTLAPPVEDMCGNSTLEGLGGFRQEFKELGDSFGSFGELKNIANIARRGAEQGDYCSEQVNFCFFEF